MVQEAQFFSNVSFGLTSVFFLFVVF